jgi:ceramide glucosyltransferase
MFIAAVVLATLSLAYLAGCIAAVWMRGSRPTPVGTEHDNQLPSPSVSILKPICGLESDLEENLKSFCNQSYPTFEVLFGARDPGDPALEVARKVAAQSSCETQVIVGGREIGSNRKVNTLANLASYVHHEVIVFADSDVRVDPSYLSRIIAPFRDPSVGVVTCLFRAVPTETAWSRLGALALNEWFRPSVLVGHALGGNAYCHGNTIALRRATLDAIGGFPALAPLLADDYEIGARVRKLGLRCVLADVETTVIVDEPSFEALIQHELRWARTIRTVEPAGYASTLLTFAIPLSLLPVAFVGEHPWALLFPGIAMAMRLGLHWVEAATHKSSRQLSGRGVDFARTAWLIPIRDLLSFGLWAAAYLKRRVLWRGQVMRVEPDGALLEGEGVRDV